MLQYFYEQEIIENREEKYKNIIGQVILKKLKVLQTTYSNLYDETTG